MTGANIEQLLHIRNNMIIVSIAKIKGKSTTGRKSKRPVSAGALNFL